VHAVASTSEKSRDVTGARGWMVVHRFGIRIGGRK
jgi:hypothetical protein